MTDRPRLIEVAFPLKQTSLDSVHEKTVRHGHISTLHIWPARRPLAACRAALITTLLPDPGDKEERDRLLERLAGHVVQKTKKRTLPSGKIEEVVTEETEGGILHWGRESGSDLAWFREQIREAYGGRAPKVLDPFAGGGAIPLEAMRLGCETTAVDINPVAWFILKCTLEYPQRLAGQTRPLPDFALADRDFMAEYFKAQGMKGTALQNALDHLSETPSLQPTLFTDHAPRTTQYAADLAWHVRAWGRWVLHKARRELASYYPTYADFQPATKGARPVEGYALRLAPLCEDGTPDMDALNAEFSKEYLADPRNPRWVAKPTVAYLWARTVTCKSCRATVPLLKTRWLCKKDSKRVLLTMSPKTEGMGVTFGIQNDIPRPTGSSAQRREYDKQVGAGTMSRSGATCPCCTTIMTMEDLRLEARSGHMGASMTAVVIDGLEGKEYRLPLGFEAQAEAQAAITLTDIFNQVPFGLPDEPTPGPAGSKMNSSSLRIYGLMSWKDLFLARQKAALGTFLIASRSVYPTALGAGYPADWSEALLMYLASMLDRLANQGSNLSRWNQGGEKVEGTFSRFALPILWDFAEVNPLGNTSGGYLSALEWVALVIDHVAQSSSSSPRPCVLQQSSKSLRAQDLDLILTDPPYYDAISYSDLMDYFYVWIRRTLHGVNIYVDQAFAEPLAVKWNAQANDGELIDNPARFDGDKALSKATYENGMYEVFRSCHSALRTDGRLVVVFAHKNPNAWETLVSAIIRAGFVTDGSWPIQTEMGTRTRALTSAALSSSVWLVCKKRSETARPGWDKSVLAEMQANITTRLRDFWDAGIRGPDFVWAATGPALEAYSRYPVVKKADEPGQLMTVTEFLTQVRRMVVDFVVGRVLSGGAEAAAGLDDATTYYLLHRNDFGMDDAPIGACILYAISCGLSDQELADRYDLLARTGSAAEAEAEVEVEAEDEVEEGEGGKGNTVRLKPWSARKGKNLGYEGPGGRPAPLIDQVHRLMHLWRAGDVAAVDDYLEGRGLRRNALFGQLLQALIELAPAGSEERALLESISNHVVARGLSAARLPGIES